MRNVIGAVVVSVILIGPASGQGVDHAGQMIECKKRINDLVGTMLDFQWGTKSEMIYPNFGPRIVRKGQVAFYDRNGKVVVDTFTCLFDPRFGNDFFIGAG